MKYKFNTRWDKNILKCACLVGNPACDRYKKCEVLEFKFNPYKDITKCMNHESYKRIRGKIQQL
ncbi:hypothetical protein [Clostridium niameyense]|uniref:hypothetical protein n=1 Tax=Clostridium niameyense TaxID=1622073 RepID=UPI00067F6B45|nr:hypothetical protein [Clostridium niameyense]